jgi:hypothetical protein
MLPVSVQRSLVELQRAEPAQRNELLGQASKTAGLRVSPFVWLQVWPPVSPFV